MEFQSCLLHVRERDLPEGAGHSVSGTDLARPFALRPSGVDIPQSAAQLCSPEPVLLAVPCGVFSSSWCERAWCQGSLVV